MTSPWAYYFVLLSHRERAAAGEEREYNGVRHVVPVTGVRDAYLALFYSCPSVEDVGTTIKQRWDILEYPRWTQNKHGISTRHTLGALHVGISRPRVHPPPVLHFASVLPLSKINITPRCPHEVRQISKASIQYPANIGHQYGLGKGTWWWRTIIIHSLQIDIRIRFVALHDLWFSIAEMAHAKWT